MPSLKDIIECTLTSSGRTASWLRLRPRVYVPDSAEYAHVLERLLSDIPVRLVTGAGRQRTAPSGHKTLQQTVCLYLPAQWQGTDIILDATTDQLHVGDTCYEVIAVEAPSGALPGGPQCSYLKVTACPAPTLEVTP